MPLTHQKRTVVQVKIADFKVVTHNFAPLLTVKKVVLFSDVRHAVEILEKHRIMFTIERFLFFIVF
jgi:hypothetical protein